MKISLITTYPNAKEVGRIETEVNNLGHQFNLINLKDFKFKVKNNKLLIPEFENSNPDIAIVRGIFNSIKPISEAVKKLRNEGVKIFDNNIINHRYSIDKLYDLVKIASTGVPLPNTSYSRNFEDFPYIAKEVGYPIIVKSIRKGQGSGVYKADSEKRLLKLIDDIKTQKETAKSHILQEFIDYEFDLRILIIGNEIFTMRRIPSKGEFRANFSLGGTVEPFELDEVGKKLAKRALESIGMSVAGVDMLITSKGKKYILEINHTPGFIGMELALGKNIGKIYVEHAIRNAV